MMVLPPTGAAPVLVGVSPDAGSGAYRLSPPPSRPPQAARDVVTAPATQGTERRTSGRTAVAHVGLVPHQPRTGKP